MSFITPAASGAAAHFGFRNKGKYNWRDRFSGVAGALLGFVAADVPGAVVGYTEAMNASRWANPDLPKKKQSGMPRSRSRSSRSRTPTRFRARSRSRESSRSSRLRSLSRARSALGSTPGTTRRGSVSSVSSKLGISRNAGSGAASGIQASAQSSNRPAMVKHNVKAVRFKRSGKVKVGKRLTKQITQVIKAKKLYPGNYIHTNYGAIGIYPLAGLGTQLTTGPYVNAYTVRSGGASTSTHWASGMRSAGPSTGVLGMDFMFFTPARFLDAASVLWCKKPAALDYTIQTGNFNIDVNQSTGVPVVGTPAAPNTLNQIIHIRKSWVTFEMRNTSARTLLIKIYTCAPKLKFPGTPPLDAYVGGVETTDSLRQNTNVTQSLISDPAVQPWMSRSFTDNWKCETTEICLEPGQTCTHSLNGPSNYDLDYNKLWDGAIDKTGFIFKGTSRCVFFEVFNDLQFTTTLKTERMYTTLNVLNDAIAMSWQCHYRLSMPEATGFHAQALIAAGTIVNLDMRKPTYATGNFAEAAVGPTDAYSRIDDEAPVSFLAGSTQN